MTENNTPMSALTAALYGALIVYLGGWFLGHWIGNFSLLLFILTMVTMVYWFAERLKFKPAREAAAPEARRRTRRPHVMSAWQLPPK